MSRAYIITGVTGNLGHVIANLLVANGQKVLGLALYHESNQHLDPRVEIIRGDVRNISTIEPLFIQTKGHEVIVIHTAGIISINPKYDANLFKVNVEGTKNIIDLCVDYQVEHLIYTSSVHALPELSGNECISEDSFCRESALYGHYSTSKQLATGYLLDAMQKGLKATIVYPSGIVSIIDSKEGLVTQMVKDYLNRKMRVYIKGGYDFVDVRDVAQAIVNIADIQDPGHCYVLSNRYYTVKEIFDILYELTGLYKVRVQIPLFLVKGAMPILASLSRIQKTPQIFTQDSLHILGANSNFSHQRAQKDLGYEPRDIRETLQELIRNLKNPMTT